LTEFRDDAEARWYSLWEDTWNQWLDSMMQTWGFSPTKSQAYAAIELLMKLEQFGDDRFNEARRRLTKSGTFKSGMLTPLEQLDEEVEAGKFGDLGTPMGKQRYAQAFNRIKFGN
jgi:hypothetical protein